MNNKMRNDWFNQSLAISKMLRHWWSFVSFVIIPWGAQGATYTLERATAESMAHVPGLHVGSSMAFKANCVNVDIQGIEDSTGTKSTPGQLMVLVADPSAGRLGPNEPEKLYFLEVSEIAGCEG